MATVFAASTPSPPPTIHTPPTPKHGWSDNWEPYSPRKSARISSRRAANRTPSPQPPTHRTPPRSTRKPIAPSAAAAIVSPAATPQKKRQPAQDSVRRSSGFLTSESSSHAASSLGIDKMDRQSSHTASTRRTGMLPTPAKTPKKVPSEKQTAQIKSVARNLFANDDEAAAVPKRKRTPKKYSGNSLESFTATEVEEKIEIFTDSQDRVPVPDSSVDNPFYGDSVAVDREPPRRRSKRKVAIPGEAAQGVDDALQREDGMVYVFRGKKIFRKFAEPEDEDDEEGSSSESRLRRPLTRSAMKPRLLFPVAPKAPATGTTLEEEEAITDIEDHHLEEDPEVEATPGTPVEVEEEAPSTPKAPKFGQTVATPPDTRRTTRSGLKKEEATPIKRKSRQSPFDDWPRVKSRQGSTVTKRAGDELEASAPKRART
ncbi:hypothetical protein CORC01_04442 [Colletotrichum orchidophilum]|uniref:Uncharacterized protein n=1 Tax=Colletotrichum orchidophilum TaxID=1209926 RepID=A0A1G4BG18_9PEZI|nr:uncharacterized protein CORC01_04442 [Colletotrichum orchidophilum]OHF00253.1 hypothetical protein CORC01_04442 [Colletotrichum orchidophilum]